MNTQRSSGEHVVSGGRVWCAKAVRDVTVETCWMCERLEGFEVEGEREIVRCVPDAVARRPVAVVA